MFKQMTLILKLKCVSDTKIALVFEAKTKQPKSKQRAKQKSSKDNTSEVNDSPNPLQGTYHFKYKRGWI
jgi:hypothetical protein